MPERTDEELLDDYVHGDRPAFADLIGRYRNQLLHFLIRFLGSRTAAEDVFQEAFVQIHLFICLPRRSIRHGGSSPGCSRSRPTRPATTTASTAVSPPCPCRPR
ncbi:MAG: RNA polymerase sigma factor [Planctomycetota bacterium]